MRTVPSATIALLENAPVGGIETRDFVWFQTVIGSNQYGFYNDIDPSVNVPVVEGSTGATVTRTYEGAGTLLSVSDIDLHTGLDVHNITVVLSNIHPRTQELVRGNDLRNARVEIHRGLVDPATGRLVDPPQLHFMGTVNQANPKRAAAGGSGGISISVTSNTLELTRTNPAMFSDATQSRRNGDRILRYNDVMGDVRPHWGANPNEVSKPPKRKKFLGIF